MSKADIAGIIAAAKRSERAAIVEQLRDLQVEYANLDIQIAVATLNTAISTIEGTKE